MTQESHSITEVLSRASGGDSGAISQLLPLVYEEMRALAAGYMQRERGNHTLQPTALVHEAYLRLVGSDQIWKGRAHFLAAAAVSMRRVLVDHARRRGADKRGAAHDRITLSAEIASSERRDTDVLELDELLTRLAAKDARKAKVVELRFFAGMTNDQIADVLDVARSTVAEDWTVARAWLAAQLGAGGGER
jgi:RNA polymerase sigma-70 factor, ECF subfamily